MEVGATSGVEAAAGWIGRRWRRSAGLSRRGVTVRDKGNSSAEEWEPGGACRRLLAPVDEPPPPAPNDRAVFPAGQASLRVEDPADARAKPGQLTRGRARRPAQQPGDLSPEGGERCRGHLGGTSGPLTATARLLPGSGENTPDSLHGCQERIDPPRASSGQAERGGSPRRWICADGAWRARGTRAQAGCATCSPTPHQLPVRGAGASYCCLRTSQSTAALRTRP
jgi:hypothetical protein